MAGAVPDWATGGAGFSQQDVGVEALLHRPFMRAHKQGDMHTQSRLSHKEDVLGGAWHRSMLQAGNGMFPWGEGQKMIIKKWVFQPQMAGWVQNNKGLMVWASVPGFKEEYICMFTRPVHTEISNYFWIAVICRALDQSAAGLWPHIVLDLCLSMCVREVKKEAWKYLWVNTVHSS